MAEFIECPVGRDLKPLRPGETVYGEDGKAWRLRAVGPTFCYADDHGVSYRLKAKWLAHEEPDSWSRLLADLRDAGEGARSVECNYYDVAPESCEGCPADDGLMDCREQFTLDLIDRINRLREAGHD